MDIAEKKLAIVKTILDTQDESVLNTITDILHQDVDIPRQNLPRMTVEELKDGIRQSEEDIKAGRTISSDELLKRYG